MCTLNLLCIGLYYSLRKAPFPKEVEASLSADYVLFSDKGKDTSTETK